MSVQRIAGRYAKSLIELAREQNKLDRVLADLQSFQEVAQNRDFAMLLKSPIISASKKQGVIDALFKGKYDELTSSFLTILVNKGREQFMPEIADEFISQYKSIQGISTVKVTTAKVMSTKSLDALKTKLEASPATNKSVEIQTAIDASLIGGFVLELDDKIYDASVAQKLEQLKRGFKN